MSRSIDPTLRAYLRHLIQEWTAAEGHTARELARLAGVSAAQISEAVNEGSIGWKTMMGVLPVLGLSLGTIEAAAQQWAASRADVLPQAQRRGHTRLQERAEWPSVAAIALDEHGELDPEDIAAVGRIVDEPTVFGGALDGPTVAGLAAVLEARRKRLERRRV